MATAPIVLRMRRDLSGNVAEPYWPAGIRIRTLNHKDKKDAMAAHAVLQASYYEGGGGAPAFKKWWPKLKKPAKSCSARRRGLERAAAFRAAHEA